MKLSLVVATLNSARFLPEALASVEPALGAGIEAEILVADGGSGDATLSIAEADPRVRIVSRQDDGLYDAMNRAIAAATGDFVLILNSDDLLPPGAVGQAVQRLSETRDAAWISGPALFGTDLRSSITCRNGAELSVEGAVFAIPAINARIYRLDFLRRLGPIRTDIGLASDREFMMRVARSEGRGADFAEPLYFYRTHEGSRTISGDKAGGLRVYRAECRLADRLLQEATASPTEARLLRASKAVAAMKLLLSRSDMSASARYLATNLPSLLRGIVLWRRWRGRLSGY